MADVRPPQTIIHFLATLNSRNRNDQIREFVVSYHVDDTAFSVTELLVPNSGFRSGQFLRKTVINNPKTGNPYKPQEIYVGAIVNLGGWEFTLQEASKDSLNIMEAKSDIFVKTDLTEIQKIIRNTLKSSNISIPELLVKFQRVDFDKTGSVPIRELQKIFSACGIDFGDQEFLTLFRRYQIDQTENFGYQGFIESLA